MIKSELVDKVHAANKHLLHHDVERAVEAVFEEIIQALVNGDKVELRDFGVFTVRHRASRTGRNPRTGEAIPVEAKRVPFFRAGKKLRDRVQAATKEAP